MIDPVAAYNAVAIVLALLGGTIDGLRLRTVAEHRRDDLNRLWHLLAFVREGIFAGAVAVPAFGWTLAALAAVGVYGAARWVVFDVAHAITVGKDPLAHIGVIAQTDRVLAKLFGSSKAGPFLRLAAYLGAYALAVFAFDAAAR